MLKISPFLLLLCSVSHPVLFAFSSIVKIYNQVSTKTVSSALQGPPGQTVYEEIVALDPPGRSRGHEPVDPRVNSRMYEAEDPTGANCQLMS